jgi:hypothetical protein
MSHFSVFSHVVKLGCIEFLNRESQVRFLPGARGEIVESDPGSPISPHLLPALPGSASLGGPVGTPRVLRNGVVVVRERHQP